MRSSGNRTGSNSRPGEGLQKKLAFGFFFLFALTSLLGALGVHQLETVATSTRDFRDRMLPRIVLINETENAVAEHAFLSKRRVQTTDFRQLAAIEKSMRAIEEQLETDLIRLQTMLAATPQEALATRAQVIWVRYLESLEEVLRLSEQGALQRAERRFAGETERHLTQVAATLLELGKTTLAEADRLSFEVDQQHQTARSLTLLVLVAALFAILGARQWVSRFISRPLLSISASMRGLTEGRDALTISELTERSDEIGTLAKAAEAFRDSLIATRNLAKDVERERAWLVATVRNLPIGMAIFDEDGGLLLSNDMLQTVFDLPDELVRTGVLGKTMLLHIAEGRGLDAPQEHSVALLRMLEAEKTINDIWDLEDGRSVEVIIHAMPSGWIVVSEDVTQRMQAERRIYRMARTDALTGRVNRLGFQERLASELEGDAPQLAVMLIDLDRFKHINDTLGHPVGDKLLQQVSERLNWVIGPDDLVARLGGDEFAVIQKDCSDVTAVSLGQEIVDQLCRHFSIDEHVVQIGGSVGIALAPRHSTRGEELLRSADLALYEAKDAGRGNCQLFHPRMSDRQQALHMLEQSLRKATVADEFVVHFQPLIDLDCNRICGAEALVRWNDPKRGLIPPVEFIPMAEELGLISEIGRTVLTAACSAAAAWPETVHVAVNLSPLQFQTSDVLADTMAALEATGLDPSRLELEITESVFLANTDRTLGILGALREAGVSVALDDFGTGYSSLRYLQSFPFDRVKIDASFVQGVPEEEGAVAIIRAICSLARTFGMSITAEGIETHRQLQFVKDSDISLGQGWLFSQALSQNEFSKLLGRGLDPVPGLSTAKAG